MLHAPVPFLGFVKHNTKSYLNIAPPQIVSLHCHCTRGHSLRHTEGKQGFMPSLRSGVGSRIEEGLLSRTEKFYIQSRERTNVFLYGILPVWILMKGLVSLDLSPANAWFNTMSFTVYPASWCFTTGTMCLHTGLSKGTPTTRVGHVVVMYSQCQTGQPLPLKPVSVISLYQSPSSVFGLCFSLHIF